MDVHKPTANGRHPGQEPLPCLVTSELVRTQREARAILLGGALGDALGWPVEFLHREEITNAFGSAGISIPPNPALTTDDTEMTVALARALVEGGEKPLELLMEHVVAHYIDWLDSHNPTRAPGSTCINGARALKRGVPWQNAGVTNGMGCGAAMRVAPVGFLYQNDEPKLLAVAAASARATHGSPVAIASAVGAALAIKFALDGHPPPELTRRIIDSIGTAAPLLEQTVERFYAARRIPVNEDALAAIGGGWSGHEALFMALLCIERSPASYVESVRMAANIDGDSDSVASIVGNIQGARLGIDALPVGWLDNLEGRTELEILAGELAAKKCALQEKTHPAD